jgi:hypothetical protein
LGKFPVVNVLAHFRGNYATGRKGGEGELGPFNVQVLIKPMQEHQPSSPQSKYPSAGPTFAAGGIPFFLF